MFDTLPGFRAFPPDELRRRNHIFALWRQSARVFRFAEFDGPVLEPLELYEAKSGPEIVSQLFHFTDKGERNVALRPEMTPTLARLVGAQANAMARPVKWFSIGEQYRYERPQKGRLRAFFQLNADILGEPGVAADAELIALLIRTLRSFGLGPDDFELRLSDRDLWMIFLEQEGFAAESAEVLRVVDRLDKLPPEKSLAALQEVVGDKAEALLARVTTLRQIDSLEAMQAFLADSPALPGRLAAWRELRSSLEAMGVGDFIRIDLGIVRGLAYYTGFVFEAFSKAGGGRALAGGGRYDDLIAKLGYPEMAAVGFGMGDVTLADLLDDLNRWPPLVETLDVFQVIGDEEYRSSALADQARLREAGYSVEVPLRTMGFGKQFKQAEKLGARLALIYGSEEREKDEVKVKDLVRAVEVSVPRTQALAVVRAVLSEGASLADPD